MSWRRSMTLVGWRPLACSQRMWNVSSCSSSSGVRRACVSGGRYSATNSTASSMMYTERGATASRRCASRPTTTAAITNTATAATRISTNVTAAIASIAVEVTARSSRAVEDQGVVHQPLECGVDETEQRVDQRRTGQLARTGHLHLPVVDQLDEVIGEIVTRPTAVEQRQHRPRQATEL